MESGLEGWSNGGYLKKSGKKKAFGDGFTLFGDAALGDRSSLNAIGCFGSEIALLIGAWFELDIYKGVERCMGCYIKMDLKVPGFSLRKKDYCTKSFRSTRIESKKNIFEVKIPFVRCEKTSLDLKEETKEPISLGPKNKIISETRIRKRFRLPFLPESIRRFDVSTPLKSVSNIKTSPKHGHSNTNGYIQNQKRSSSTLNTRYRDMKNLAVPGRFREIVVILNNLLS